MGTILAGNWKMNLGIKESVDLASAIVEGCKDAGNTDVWIAPSAQALTAVFEATKSSSVKLGGQNVHWEDKGAFTGELSVSMLNECGCEFAIVGHSERRTLFLESNELIARRTHGAVSKGLTAILCIGETLEERENGVTNQILETQLNAVLDGFPQNCFEKLVIAYEPVWAIGTGKVASSAEIEAAHASIVDYLAGAKVPEGTPVLYGGSVKPDNFSEIISIPNVSGALVGGASLKADQFLALKDIAQKA